MDRTKAIRLWESLIGGGFSTSLSCGVHPDHMPRENYAVTVEGIRFERVKLETIMDIADTHDAEVHLLGGVIRLLDKPDADVKF